MFNGPYDVFQGCTPSGWVAFHTPLDTPIIPNCPNIGDYCHTDGTIYAGEFNGVKLYAAADDGGTALAWGPDYPDLNFCRDTNPIEDACDMGWENTETLKNAAGSYPAAEYCADLDAHGYDSGWFLPSQRELDEIWKNLKSGKPSATYNFQYSRYWSSSGKGIYAWSQAWSNGIKNASLGKGVAYGVRCIRH